MGADLFSACVFCAGMLFNIDLVPPKGFSGELAAGYATLQRQITSGSPAIDDRGDVTEKFGSVGFRWTREADDELGAGTPVSEFRMRYVFPSSHDESSQAKRSPIQVYATGTGRYENWIGLGRRAFGASDSLELGFEQRRHRATDLVNINPQPYLFTYQRDLIAENIELGLGWRHRWRNFELAGGAEGQHLEGRTSTPVSKIVASGTLVGGRLELRGRKGPWTASLLARATTGSLDVEESTLVNGRRVESRPAWIEALTLSLERRIQKFDVMLSGSYDKSRLPFVAMASTGSEQLAMDAGYHPDSRTKQWLVELVIRHEIVPGVFPRFYFRFTHGNEAVSLTDSNGVLQPLSFQMIRGGQFPPVGSNPTAPEFGLGFGLEAALGPSGRSN